MFRDECDRCIESLDSGLTITISVAENVMFRVKRRGHELVAAHTTEEVGTDAGMTLSNFSESPLQPI